MPSMSIKCKSDLLFDKTECHKQSSKDNKNWSGSPLTVGGKTFILDLITSIHPFLLISFWLSLQSLHALDTIAKANSLAMSG